MWKTSAEKLYYSHVNNVTKLVTTVLLTSLKYTQTTQHRVTTVPVRLHAGGSLQQVLARKRDPFRDACGQGYEGGSARGGRTSTKSGFITCYIKGFASFVPY